MKAVENESQLIIDACHGSVPAFEALVVLYEPRIRRMLYSMTQDAQLTQDLCQESFLAAYRALHRMNGEEHCAESAAQRVAQA
jgi:RNA polymerase sigma-70 factor, ECF subfamily